jgi:hypothetical protein
MTGPAYENYRKCREDAAKFKAKKDFKQALESIDMAILYAPDGELLAIAESVRREVAPKAADSVLNRLRQGYEEAPKRTGSLLGRLAFWRGATS